MRRLGEQDIFSDARALAVLLGWAAGIDTHTILSATHTDSDAADVPVLHDVLTWNGLKWDAESFQSIILQLGGVMIGREEGAHIWLRVMRPPGNTGAAFLAGDVLLLEATNNDGVPIWSYDYTLDRTNTAHLKIGNDTRPQITLEVPTAVVGEPDQLVGVVIPVDGFDRLLLHGDIDITDLVANLALMHGPVLPEPLDYPAGTPFLLQSAGDPNLFILYLRDHLDNWQMIGGAGYMAGHTHTSADTGGALNLAGDYYEPLTDGVDDPCELITAGGDVIMVHLTNGWEL